MVPKLLRYPRQRWTYQGSHSPPSSTTHLLRMTEAWAKNWKTHPTTEPLLPKQEVICGRLLLLHSYTGSYSKFVSSEVISCPCGELQTRTHILRDPPPLPRPLPRPWGGPYHPDILDRRKGTKALSNFVEKSGAQALTRFRDLNQPYGTYPYLWRRHRRGYCRRPW